MIRGPPDGNRNVSESLKTTELHDLVDRIQAGDREAADALIRRSAERLENLASKMLKGFPGVARWEQTGDVFNSAVARLLRTLGEVTPDSVAGFFSLAAQAVRRRTARPRPALLRSDQPGGPPREPAGRAAARISLGELVRKRSATWNGGRPFTRRSNGCRRTTASSSNSAITRDWPRKSLPDCIR